MKKTKLTRSLLAACSIVALSAVMYGCTHSSGPSQDELDAANEATAKAEDEAKTNADAAADAVQAKADADAAAEVARMAREVADAAAEEARMAREAAEAQSALDAQAKIDADAAATEADEAAEKARKAADAAEKVADEAIKAQMDAEAERDAAQMEADRLQGEADEAAEAKASDDAKELLNMALRNRMLNDAGDGDSDDEVLIQARKPSPTLSFSNDGVLMAEGTVEATDEAAAIVYTMADMAPDMMIEGWRGAMLTNEGGDTAVVYSDIGKDGSESLLDRYVSNLPDARTWPIDNDDDMETDGDNDPATDNEDNDISWSDVMRDDNTVTVSGSNPASPKASFKGRVHNIPGTFSCTGTTCVAPVRFSDGSVQTETDDAAANPFAVGEWNFKPDEGADIYTDDTDYITFGWWLDKGEDGKPDYVRLITDAEGEDLAMRTNTNTNGNAIRGSATYEGAAAGIYAMASTAGDMYEGGHFTATATIEVDFDVDLLATDEPNTNDRDGIALSGTIDNFMTGDTPRDWSVTLTADGTPDDPMTPTTANATAGAQPLTTLVDVDDGDSTMTTEWSTGVAQNGEGTWTAEWYGSDKDAHPEAVTGTFNANIGTDDADAGAVGRLQGAFGANKE